MVVDTYLLINDDINFHTLLGLALKKPVKAPLWMIRRRTAEIELGGQPPVLDEGHRNDQYNCEG